jgi:hypothetical protein
MEDWHDICYGIIVYTYHTKRIGTITARRNPSLQVNKDNTNFSQLSSFSVGIMQNIRVARII